MNQQDNEMFKKYIRTQMKCLTAEQKKIVNVKSNEFKKLQNEFMPGMSKDMKNDMCLRNKVDIIMSMVM